MVMRSRSERVTALARNGADGARDGDLVRDGEELQLEERSEEMRGRGEDSAFEDGGASAGFDEEEFAVETDFVVDAEPPVEIEQIDAAAQQDVLAVVDHLGVFTAGRPDVARPPGKFRAS